MLRKRMLAALLCLCLIMGLGTPTYGAEEAPEPEAAGEAKPVREDADGLDFYALETSEMGTGIKAQGSCGKNGDDLTWTLEIDGTLTISGEGEMEDYRDAWLGEGGTAEEIPVETVMGEEYAPWFWHVRNIWDEWGMDSSGNRIPQISLKEIVIQEGVTGVGAYAFSGIGIGNARVSIPSSVSSIGDGAFHGSYLSEITLPEGVTHIGTGAFMACSLAEVEIPSTVDSIGGGAFALNTRIVYEDPEYAKYHFEDLDITVHPENEAYRVVDGVLYSADMTELLYYPELKPGTHFDIPTSVTSIGGCAFYASKLVSVTFPEDLEKIGWSAFREAHELREARFPDNVQEIEPCAFHRCLALADVTLPASLGCLEYSVFEGCKALWRVHIPSGVERVENFAFYFSGLACVHIPKSVTSIGWSGLGNGPWLDIYYEGSEADWSRISIDEDEFDYFFDVTVHYNSGSDQRLGIPVWITSVSNHGTSIQYNGPDLPRNTVALAVSLEDGQFQDAGLGTYGGSKGRFDFSRRLEEGCRVFLLAPDTLVPVSESAVLMGTRK